MNCTIRGKAVSRKLLASILVLPSFLLLLLYSSYLNRTPIFLPPYEPPFHFVSMMPVAMDNDKLTNDTWIVVTTEVDPTKALRKLTSLGYNIVVVANENTPKNWSLPGCVYLSLEIQKLLDYEILHHLPFRGHARKNLGYLYAIQQGAKFIYDINDDIEPDGDKLRFFKSRYNSGLVYNDNSSHVMNPYFHFGQPSVWPRGFPIDYLGIPMKNTYKICKFLTPAVQQGIVNGDPDLDSIFLLTRSNPEEGAIRMPFDKNAPPLVLPRGIFAPYNSKSAFHTYDSFWSLVLPVSVSPRVADIWRSYWAQRLLWLTGHHIGFLSSNSQSSTNQHQKNTVLFIEDEVLYSESGHLVSFLSGWNCNQTSFYECMHRLSWDMANRGFWNISEAQLISAWVKDLIAIGYAEPDLITNESQLPCLTEPRSVIFSPVLQKEPNQYDAAGKDHIQEFCHGFLPRTTETRRPTFVNNILLIIIFNLPHYEILRFVDALYFDHFPNIVYCGAIDSDWKVLQDQLKKGAIPEYTRPISFINSTNFRGFYSYDCVLKALEMRYNVDGFLILGDDLLFNYWKLHPFPLQDIILEKPEYFTINRHNKEYSKWSWWDSEVLGKVPTNNAIEELYVIASGKGELYNDPGVIELISQTVSNLDLTRVSVDVPDIYYIPGELVDKFYYVIQVFQRHHVFVEIAVPTTLQVISPGNITFLEGSSISSPDRFQQPMKYFNLSTNFLHPVKLSIMKDDPGFKASYCQLYIKNLIDNW